MPIYLFVLLYCILKSVYVMQKKHRLSSYLWSSMISKFQFHQLRFSKKNQRKQHNLSDAELGFGNSNGNITEKKEMEISKCQIHSESADKLISFTSLNSLDEEQDQSSQKYFQWETFFQYFKLEFCGKSNRSLYTLRNISPKSRTFIILGIVLYNVISTFTYLATRLTSRDSFNLVYLQIFFFEAIFALSFPNFITIVTCLKEFSFISYLTRQVGLYLIHITMIVFQLKTLEILFFIYYILVVVLYYDPCSMTPYFQTENQHQNTLEMYHLTFLGKIHGRFMFFYVRRVDESNFRVIIAYALNKQLQVYKESNFGNKNVHKLHFDKKHKLLTLWTKAPDTGIEIAIYHVPSLKCLQATSLYRSPAANVYGYENCPQKYCLINKQGHNVHLFEGNVYLTAIPIPGRPGAYDDFFVYEASHGSEILLGKIQNTNETTDYRVYRIVKEKKIWIAEDKIEFDEVITSQILISKEKLIFISASWNIYVYDPNTLQRIDVFSNQLLPNSIYCQTKYHADQELFEVEINKEGANFLIPDITRPKVLARMEKKEFNSLFFLNYKPIILCFQKSGKFFKRTVKYSIFDLPKKEELYNELTPSQTDLENFYTQVPEISELQK
ncbi:transmembrane protein, putative (macronuclear) [Tetrahymena thermophila SB210]|uniref:Transmembrane protein, putative n=1 Tax=Tetrahymena thermophila (strain SB210) TaxID=312017 RepID=Q23C24_TETTS|nr:transmembrane protein, putative [Tetrahymena thermophila SB210]EAR93944.2 transmembrane protein, putative [Tetrahymena thermophila SB210]|eukprot:XP_001014189.2 transmembrane protein, putative [Tetrahymena thermophila SB210]